VLELTKATVPTRIHDKKHLNKNTRFKGFLRIHSSVPLYDKKHQVQYNHNANISRNV